MRKMVFTKGVKTISVHPVDLQDVEPACNAMRPPVALCAAFRAGSIAGRSCASCLTAPCRISGKVGKTVMRISLQPYWKAMFLGLGLSLCAAGADDPAEVPARLANGTVIEGTVLEATAEGLVIQGARNKYTAPWKYLSCGTRYRYQRQMRSAPEAAHTNVPKKASGAAKPAGKPSGK